MMKAYTTLFLVILSFSLMAQNFNWGEIDLNGAKGDYGYIPQVTSAVVWETNFNSLFDSINQNNIQLSSQSSKTFILDIPFPDGNIEKVEFTPINTMHPDLQAKYPEIQTFKGFNIKSPQHKIHLTLSPYNGFNVFGESKEGTFEIAPYSKDLNKVILYYTKNLIHTEEDVHKCFVDEIGVESLPTPSPTTLKTESTDGILRTYRFALASTIEHSEFHYTAAGLANGTLEEKKAAVLAGMTTVLNGINLVLNRDVGVHLELIANNDQIIFIDSDNYSNNVMDAADENGDILLPIIGSTSYDLGYVFTNLGGGVGTKFGPCNSWYYVKANGTAGLPTPTGYNMIKLALHEIGHQFTADHTQNADCNRWIGTSVGPGSGSTLLSYAGTCVPNVQSIADDYYHTVSIEQMRTFVLNEGNSCPTKTSFTNQEPTVNALKNYTVPVSTPLVLEAVATDAENDPLTYCWEQLDIEVVPDFEIQTPTAAAGPVIRSLRPQASPNRYLPNMETILVGELGGFGTSNTWEVIPSVTRTMDFKVTVRDNNSEICQIQSQEMTVSFTNTAGPFAVTSQNNPTTWGANTTQTVTWDVANTDIGLVNTPNVTILFSADGGQNYDIVLANSTPNDGSHQITVPNVSTSNGRLMVRGLANIFLDVNNADISIENVSSTYNSILNDNRFNIHPVPSNGNFTLSSYNLTKGVYEIKVIDALGQLIINNIHKHPGGDFEESYNTHLVNGLYFIIIADNENNYATKKILIK